MLFPSITFLFYFLPLFAILYYAAPGVTAKNVVLVAASLLFYAWGEPVFVLLLAGEILFNFAAALAIGAAHGNRRRLLTGLAVAANLAVLGLFKYADFALGTINTIAGNSFTLPGLALPLGISFFTFHAISYLVDVHRGAAPNRSLLAIAVYIAMFPQLVAGPIVRYHMIARRLQARRTSFGRISAALRIFIIGLAQKLLVADEVARVAEAVFDKANAPSLAEAWLGLSAYTIQIYFDFAGYSNMAIGLGLALGFSFPRNFTLPYVSRSITEFWRRWHISLSQWLRDYLYIPLGGNRGTSAETYRNLCLVFLACGLWHGANWTFVIWGVHHGAFLVIERAGFGRALAQAPVWVARVYALAAIMSGWVWFRARDLEHAFSFFGSLAGLHGASGLGMTTHIALHPATVAALVVGVVLATVEIRIWRALRHLTRLAQPIYALGDAAAITAMFGLSLLNVAAGSYSAFLYFRF